MKYCSYCGSELASQDVVFCANCGKKLPPHEAGITEPLTEEMRPESVPEKAAQEKKPAKETKPSKEKKKKYRLEAVPKEPTPVDDGYDGYYDDVLPPDMDRVREGLDIAFSKCSKRRLNPMNTWTSPFWERNENLGLSWLRSKKMRSKWP